MLPAEPTPHTVRKAGPFPPLPARMRSPTRTQPSLSSLTLSSQPHPAYGPLEKPTGPFHSQLTSQIAGRYTRRKKTHRHGKDFFLTIIKLQHGSCEDSERFIEQKYPIRGEKRNGRIARW